MRGALRPAIPGGAVYSIYPYVTVTVPNGGEIWNGCSSQNITWTGYGSAGPWKVEYSSNNGTSWSTLTSGTSNSYFTWSPVPNAAGTNYLVRVTSTADALVTDVSNATFTVTQNTAIIVTSPNGGENWQVANPATELITWTQTGASNYYNIYYSIDNGSTWISIITDTYITSNQYTWTIPNNPSSQVLVKVEDYNNTCKFDVSNNPFTILAPTPVITVTSPNGGNIFYVGTSYNISWTSAYLTSPYVKIEYSTNNGGAWSTIIASTNNTGSYTWPVPNTPSVQCLVRVSEYGIPTVYDISNAVFSIVYPYVTVTSPNGSENWAGCASQNITWTGYGSTGPWKVEYSPDNGTTWSTLVTSTSNSYYTWSPIPNIGGSQYIVRVTSTADALVTDNSNAVFTVTQTFPIIINSPNGGENWQVGGATHLITWAWSGTSNYYNLYYSINNGSTWISIISDTYITNGQYTWTIPNNPSTQCLVKVEDYNNTYKYDVSDAVFTISSPTPYITVTSPNGGNIFYVGTAYNISWTYGYLSSSFVVIDYSINNGSTWNSITASANNTGSYAWMVPNTPSANCLVRVSEYGIPSVYDVSNAVFSIVYPYVTVSVPNGGEIWNGCSSQNITWTGYGSAGPWKVEYSSNNGASWNTLVSSTSNSYYTWSPVPNSPGTNYIVRVTSTADVLVTDNSNGPFTVTQNTAIIVTSPNGGENWQVANPTTRLITWTQTGASNYYDIYYSTDNGATWNTIITDTYITSNQYTWTIPNTPSSQVLVKVEDYNNTCKFDISDAIFTIQAPTPIITVTSPNGGNLFYVGTANNITWTSQYLTSSFVKIEYSTDNGATWSVIITATNNTGSYSWTAPNTPSTQCLVRVSEYGIPSVYDVSNAVFSIVSPYILVTSPNGGENWNGCVSQNITWTGYGTGTGPYMVEYSIDNGFSWSTLTSSTTNSYYTWSPIPNISSSQALVRVSLASNSSLNDVSNADFNLNTQIYIIINSPNGGENWQVGNPATRTITWASANVSNYYNLYYSNNGGTTWTTIITDTYITSNQYVWTVPNDPTNNALIKIEDYNNTCKYDISDAPFKILAPTPAITVTYPNGGQTLYGYNTANITWTSAYLASSFVKIEYSIDSSATWVVIAGSTNNTGSYSWTVPNISTTKALIRVTDFGNNATYDISDAVFSIKPAVIITAPNGGENLGGCTVTTITWVGEGTSGTYQLQYSINGGSTWNTIVSQSFTGGPNYSYNWTLPNTPSNYCLVKVTNTGNTNKVDQSDAVFNITPTITVTNPNNGGSYLVGSTMNITWTAQGVSNYYNIEYTTNGGTTWNSIVFNSYITTNSYSWTIPNAPSTNCYIRVTDYNSSCKQDQSDLAFTIAAAPAAITVTSPNGGENWTVCSTHNITWSANSTSGSFKIEYSANNGTSWSTVTTNYASSNGIYSWVLPATPTIQGLIRVSDYSNGALIDQSNSVFTISALSAPGTISGNTTVCQSSSQTYSVPLVTGSTSYTWTLPAGWTGISTSNLINVVAGATSGNISVVANNACSSSSVSVLAVAVTPLPSSPGAITGNISPCSGITQTYTITSVTGTTSYSWLLPSGYSGSSTTNSINAIIGSNAGVIQVFALNSCGSNGNSSLTITPGGSSLPLLPGNISGTTAPCVGSTQVYSITPVSGATTYTWTLPSGWSGSSSTNSISTTVGNAGGTISVTANNSCGSSPIQNLTVTVSSVPVQPGTITGNISVCLNSANVYSIAAVSGASNYTWTLPTGWTGLSTSTSINATAAGISGNVQVTANNGCGASVPRTLAVTVNSPVTPAVSIVVSPTGPICGNASVTFTATPVNGGTPAYQWIKNNVAAGTNSPTYNASSWNVNDTIWVMLTSNVSCVTTPIVLSNKIGLNVTPVVTPTITISTNSTSICSGQSVTFNSVINGGGSAPAYQWKKNGSNISGATASSYTTSTIINGDIFTCTLVSNAGCASPVSTTSNSLTMTVSNNFVPSVTISASPTGSICAGTSVTFTSNPTNGGSTPVYNWTLNGVSVGSSSSYITSALNNNDSVKCYLTSSLACVSPATIVSNKITETVNQNVTAVVNISADNNPICIGQTVTYTALPVNGGTLPTYQWRKNSAIIGGATSSTYSTSTIANGDVFDVVMTSNYSCLLKAKDTSNAITMAVSSSVTPSVVITISPNDTVCSGTTAVFTATPLNGGSSPSYQWKKNGANIGGATAATYSSSTLADGDLITVVMSSNASCASPTTATSNTIAIRVFANTTASVSITGNPVSPVCTGTGVTFTATPVNGGASPAFQWKLNGSIIPGATSASYAAPSVSNGDQIIALMNTSQMCATPSTATSNTLTYNVNSIPLTPGSITGNTSTCESVINTYSVTPVSGATSYTWTLPSGWTGTSTSSSINATAGSASGNITVTANNSCGSSSAQTLAITVSPLPILPGTITGNATVCSGTSNTYSISPVTYATSYTWTLPTGWTGTSTTTSIATTASSTGGNITVKANNACGSSALQTLAVTVNSIPATPGSISGNTSDCSSTSNTYSVSAVSGATSYTWTLPGGWSGTSTTTSIITTSNSIGGNITVTANNSCGSSVAQTLAVSVSSIPVTPGTITGNTTTCQAAVNTYSVTPVSGATSYTWTLPSGWTGTSTTSSITATAGSTSGNVIVIANNVCGSSLPQTQAVTVNPIPAQPGIITGNATVCSGTSNTYSISPVTYATSYTWVLPSGWTGTSTTTSIATIAGSSGGSITVKANNGCGSSTVQTFAVTVNSVPATPGAISGNASICSGSSNTYSITAVSGATSYTWTLPGGWSGSSTTTSIATTSNTTGGNITVIANNGCGNSGSQILAVTVSSIPATPGSITGNTTTCQTAVNTYSVTPVSGATSYTWTLPGGWTGSSVTSSINATAGSASGNVTVVANNSCGSSSAQSLAVTVDPIPVQPGTITGNATVCSGTSNTYSISTVNNATSYTWTLPSGWTGTSTTTSIVTTAGSASGNITVTANNACGSSSVQTLVITVNSVPATPAAISGNVSICSNSSNTYSITTVSGATSYTWNLPAGWSGSSTTTSITTISNISGGNITVTANNSCGSSGIQTLAVTVSTIPATPGVISGNTTTCQTALNIYSVSPVSGATSYTWTMPSGWTGSSVTNSINATAGSSSGNVTVVANNACGSSAAQNLAVTVNPTPAQPGTITGNATICSGTSNTYSISAVPNATSYTWTLPSGWSGTSNTTSISAIAGAAGGNIIVKANNACGSSVVQTLAVTVNAAPSTPGNISGNISICSGTSNTYSITSVSGATSYTWTLPGGWAGSSTTTSINATSNSTGGNISVTADNSCGSSSPQTLAVTVNSVPATPGNITGNTTTCQSVANTYSVIPVSGATSYTWSLPTGWTGSSVSSSITATAGTVTGNITVTAVNSCGNSAPQTLAVTVNNLPSQPGSISGNTIICSGTSNTYTISPVSGATSYTWTMPFGWTGTSTTTSIGTTASATSGNLTITANNSCGASTFQSLAVTVNTIPTTPGVISGNASICSGSSNIYSIIPVSGATSYTWTLPSGWSGTSTSASITTSANSTGGSISVTANNGCGNSTASTLPITVNTIPATAGTISGNATPCNGVTEVYSIAPVSGATSYSWTLPAGFTGSSATNTISVLTGSNPGTIQVYADNLCGSGGATSLLISPNGNTVPLQPGIITGATTSCSGGTQIYSIVTVPGATSYTWTLPNGWTGTSTTESISVTTGNSGGTISVTANDACGSSPAQTLPVTINTIPATPGTITGSTSVCSGSSYTYSVTPVSGATSYTWTLPAGWNGTSATNSITATAGITGGNLTVTANNTCGNSAPNTLSVTGHNPTAPTVTVNGGDITSTSATGNQWYYQGNPISGATNQNYTVAQNGLYFDLYTDAFGCSVSSDTINYVWVGIAENNVQENLSVYPNPNNGEFTIDWTGPASGKIKIAIYSSLGEIVYTKEMINESKPVIIDLLTAAQGVYLLQATSAYSTITKKLIVR